MAMEMTKVSNQLNFGSWVGRLTCTEKSGQREYPMISGLVRKKRYGIQCPENIGAASTWKPMYGIRFCISIMPVMLKSVIWKVICLFVTMNLIQL